MRTIFAVPASLLMALTIASGPAHSEDQGAVAERFIRAVYTGDTATVNELAANDVILSYPIFRELFGSSSIRGRDAVVAFSEGFSSRWLNQTLSIHETVSDGKVVVLVWSFRATRAGDNKGAEEASAESSWGGISYFRFNAEGKISEEVGEESTPGPFDRLLEPDANGPREFSLESHGDSIRVLHFPAIEPSSATSAILLVPGWPATGRDILGFGSGLSAKGVHCFVLRPRGHGGSGGEATFSNAVEDVGVVWDWISSAERAASLGAEVQRVLAGYSWGGGIAMAFAAQHPSVERVVSIAGSDHGVFIRRLDEDPDYGAFYRGALESTRAPAGPVQFDLEMTLDELRTMHAQHDLVTLAPRLADRDILIIAGWDDEQVEIEHQVLPFYRALHAEDAGAVEIRTYQDGHGFRRVREKLVDDVYRWIMRPSAPHQERVPPSGTE